MDLPDGDWTIGTWFWQDAYVVTGFFANTSDPTLWRFSTQAGNKVGFHIVDDSSATGILVSTDTYSINTWNHLLAARRSSTNIDLYLNGSEVSYGTNTVNAQEACTPGALQFYGIIDNGALGPATIWNRALSTDEIAALGAGYDYSFMPGAVAHIPMVDNVQEVVAGWANNTDNSGGYDGHPNIIYPTGFTRKSLGGVPGSANVYWRKRRRAS